MYAVNHPISLRTTIFAHCYAIYMNKEHRKETFFLLLSFLSSSLFWSRSESVGLFARGRFHAYNVWNLRNLAIAKMHGWWLYKMIYQAWDGIIIIIIFCWEIGRRRGGRRRSEVNCRAYMPYCTTYQREKWKCLTEQWIMIFVIYFSVLFSEGCCNAQAQVRQKWKRWTDGCAHHHTHKHTHTERKREVEMCSRLRGGWGRCCNVTAAML